jgi:hypothetical protein
MCVGSVFRIECIAIVTDSSDEQPFYSNNAQWLLRRFRVWKCNAGSQGSPATYTISHLPHQLRSLSSQLHLGSSTSATHVRSTQEEGSDGDIDGGISRATSWPFSASLRLFRAFAFPDVEGECGGTPNPLKKGWDGGGVWR